MESGIRAATPAIAVRTAAVPEPFPACIEQSLAGLRAGVWRCIGHIASAPCPHVHSAAACRSSALTHIAIGTSATVLTWQNNQMTATGPSTRRSRVIRRNLSAQLVGVSNVAGSTAPAAHVRPGVDHDEVRGNRKEIRARSFAGRAVLGIHLGGSECEYNRALLTIPDPTRLDFEEQCRARGLLFWRD